MFGRKKKSYVVSLSFERYDFPHLVGMQYANDVDFKINSAEYYGEKLNSEELQKITDEKIMTQIAKLAGAKLYGN